jgi:hypothetical protein
MWIRKLCPALLFIGSLVLFFCTLAPTVTFVDSGELIVTAKNLGVAHPPGFPLYLLITHFFTLLPLGNVAQRMHFASALFAAIAVVLVYFVTIEAIFSRQDQATKQNTSKRSSRDTQASLPAELACIPGLIAGGLAAFSRTLWSYATVAEVYTLNALLILSVILLLLHWRNNIAGRQLLSSGGGRPSRNEGAKQSGDKTLNSMPEAAGLRENCLFYIAAFVFGLALGVHHVTVGLMLPAAIWLVYATRGIYFFRSRQMVFAILACLAGCAIYIYLPIAASRATVMNWGNPDTLERFWIHVTGRQYQTFFSFSPDQIQRQLSSFMRFAFQEFSWPWLPASLMLAVIGFFSLYRRERALLIFFMLVIGFNLLFSIGYEISEDKDAYSLPAFLALAIAAGIGSSAIFSAAKERKRVITAIILLLVPVVAFAANVRINNRHNYHIAGDYVSNIFSAIAPNGLLLTADWQVASPMLYFQEISRQRPDVICIDIMLLRRSWYYGYLESRYPDLMRQARDSVQPFMEDLLRWEKDPEAYQRDPQLNQRIDMRFNSMISTLVGKHIPSGPAYATVDVVLNSGGENQTLAKTLLNSYQIVPRGLVFQLFADRDSHPALLPRLNMRGLMNRAPSINEDPVVRQKVLPVYAIMLVNCGRALAAQGDEEHAMEAYRQAWAIDSALVIERNLLPTGISFENR